MLWSGLVSRVGASHRVNIIAPQFKIGLWFFVARVTMEFVVPPVLTEPPVWSEQPDHPATKALRARKELR